MADKTLNTVIQLRRGTTAQWTAIANTFVPAAGEACVTLDGVYASQVKFGDGTKTWGQLNYAGIVSGDNKSIQSVNGVLSIPGYADALQGQFLRKGADGLEWVAFNPESLGTVSKEITSTNGNKASIFNEADGGGVLFENADGTKSFIGVNDGGAEGITAQIYSKNTTTNKGSRINVTNEGIYYTTGKTNSTYTEDDELVTKADIKALTGATHFIGLVTVFDTDTFETAVERLMTEKSHEPVSGDIIIANINTCNREFIFDGERWDELGNEQITNGYATVDSLLQEASDRNDVDEALQANIDAIKMKREPFFDATANVFFANGTPIVISDSGTDNLVTYYGANSSAGNPKTMNIPYGSIVFGGGDGHEKGQYYASSLIIIDGGKLQRVYGGPYGAGSVGNSTIVLNGGTITAGLHGGGQRGNTLPHSNSTGFARIIMNGGTCSSVLSAGGVDKVSVGSAEVTINGGSVNYLYGAGSNGTTGFTTMNINGGTIAHALSVVRGSVENVEWNIKGGTITELYAGTDADTDDDGIIKVVKVHALGGTITKLYKGYSNKVEGNFNCSGTYVDDVIGNETAAIAACSLVLDSDYNNLTTLVNKTQNLNLNGELSTDYLIQGSNTLILDGGSASI